MTAVRWRFDEQAAHAIIYDSSPNARTCNATSSHTGISVVAENCEPFIPCRSGSVLLQKTANVVLQTLQYAYSQDN